jgi:hypothetical protein
LGPSPNENRLCEKSGLVSMFKYFFSLSKSHPLLTPPSPPFKKLPFGEKYQKREEKTEKEKEKGKYQNRKNLAIILYYTEN